MEGACPKGDVGDGRGLFEAEIASGKQIAGLTTGAGTKRRAVVSVGFTFVLVLSFKRNRPFALILMLA